MSPEDYYVEHEMRRRWAPFYTLKYARCRFLVVGVPPWMRPLVQWLSRKWEKK